MSVMVEEFLLTSVGKVSEVCPSYVRGGQLAAHLEKRSMSSRSDANSKLAR